MVLLGIKGLMCRVHSVYVSGIRGLGFDSMHRRPVFSMQVVDNFNMAVIHNSK